MIPGNTGDTKQTVRIPASYTCFIAAILDDGVPEERKLGTDMGLRILKVCEEVWVCGSELSSGMEQEIRAARQLQIPLRRVSEQEIGWELCEVPIQKGMEMGG